MALGHVRTLALASHWVEIRKIDGQIYFWNRLDDSRTWTLPDGIRAMWVTERLHKGQLVYWNRATREVTWQLPKLTDTTQESPEEERSQHYMSRDLLRPSSCDGASWLAGGMGDKEVVIPRAPVPSTTSSRHVCPGFKVFVLGLPRCGTSSLHAAFLSCELRSTYWALGVGQDKSADIHLRKTGDRAHERLVALVMERAVSEGLPPLAYLPETDAVTQMDGLVWAGAGQQVVVGSFPQMTMLHELYTAHPDAHFILNVRNTLTWVRSVQEWMNGDLLKRLVCANLPGLPVGQGQKADELATWFDWHIENVRAFFDAKDKAKLLIFDVEEGDPDCLRRFLGCPDLVWESNKKAEAGKKSRAKKR